MDEPQAIGSVLASDSKIKLFELSPEEIARRQHEQDQLDATDRDRRRRERLQAFLFSVGDLHSRCRLHNFEANAGQQMRVLTACKEYADTMQERIDNREGLVLYGPTGTGKDHLAVSLGGIAVERHGLHVKLINGQEWLGEVRDAMDGGISERTLLREVSWQDVLIVSDPLPPFGQLGQHMAMMLYRLIEQRDCRGKVTWVTINVASDKEADERLGAPTWDRICDRSWKLHCAWASRRKAKVTI